MIIYLVVGSSYDYFDLDKAYKEEKIAQMRADILNDENIDDYWYSVEKIEMIEF